MPALLIVDDDPHIREFAEFAARRAGFDPVATAQNGMAALTLLRTPGAELPQVILTDVSMPEINGHALVAALKADPATAEIPVYVFSSSGWLNDREQALAAGAETFYEKPTNLEGFNTLLAEIHAETASAQKVSHSG